MAALDFGQLSQLIGTVFHPTTGEKALVLLTDLPSSAAPDNAEWADRRALCREWFDLLIAHREELPFSAVQLFTYPNIGSNNNDLPVTMHPVSPPSGNEATVSLAEVLSGAAVVIAMTEFSATAPLKVLARSYGFRGATMPGFSRAMIPALGLNYEEVHRKVTHYKTLMDSAERITLRLSARGETFVAVFDTRFRTGHASGGLMRESGSVGNLPSGEAYIVPYEGEREGDPSRSQGLLPVQFGEELVVYRIEQNRAIAVLSQGTVSRKEEALLAEEPAYGNIAEIGLGVLGQWGVEACGSTLLDEKLGLHVAFGRSEHFGGVTGPSSFQNPKRVVHIDRVYVPSVQPLVSVREVSFLINGNELPVMTDGRYVA